MAAKVCILTTVHQPFDTRVFHKEAKSLLRAGYDVVLIAQHRADEVVDGVRIRALPIPRNRFSRITRLTWRLLRLALRERADVYHLQDPELLLVGALLKLVTRSKVVYDVHEDYPAAILEKRWIPRAARRAVGTVFSLIEKTLSLLCDAVVTVNEPVLERLSHRQGIVVANYPALRRGVPAQREASSPGGIDCVYHGGLTFINGIREMIQTLGALPADLSVHLTLLGRLEDPELSAEIEAAPFVEYVGLVPYEQVWSYLERADIGLILYHPVENALWSSPNKLFEFMAAGLPVVGSDLPAWREIVNGSGCGILVDALDLGEIGKAIERLARDAGLRAEMGGNARRAAVEKYNWTNEEAKLLTLYERLLAHGS